MPTIATQNARIQYWKTGTGPAVILVQGAGVIGEGWRPQIDALKDRYTVIWIDNRGIGQSVITAGGLTVEQMADDVLAVADTENLPRFHLAGHSLGGLVAQQVALRAPERVNSLALLCTFHKGRQGAAMSLSLLLTAIRSRIGTRRMRRHAFVELVMPAAYLSSVDRDQLCESLNGLFGRDLADQPSIVMRQVRAMSKFDVSGALGRLKGVPTLVVSAEHDRIARPEYGRALAAAIPGATFVELKGSGHAVTIQCPDEVNALLAGHFEAITSFQLSAPSLQLDPG
jgi:pimeloyl-ACP methyl ester carboxylesterase